MADAVERLIDVLGFDPRHNGNPGNDAVSNALKRIQDEKAVEQEQKAYETLQKAQDLVRQMDVAEKEFLKNKNKFQSQIRDLLNGIGMLGNQPVPPGVEVVIPTESA